MKWIALGATTLLQLMLILTGCGGGDNVSPPPTATLSGTLAYVVSECRDDQSSGYFFRQAVRIQQGEREPITVMEVPDIGPLHVGGFCKNTSRYRYGPNSPARGAVQRLAVSPDGSIVAFELSDDFSIVARSFLPAERKGIFVVRADGGGLHRLGPPSQQVSWLNPPGWYFNDLSFSPDGRTLTFPDLGPDPAGAEAGQIFLQDVVTGTRTQITHLSPATPAADVQPGYPSTSQPVFVDDDTVGFLTYVGVGGSNPEGEVVSATVKRDGSIKVLPPVVAQPGSRIDPTFVITGDRPVPVTLTVLAEPVNHPPNSGQTRILEVILVDGDNVLQLTKFNRADTFSGLLGVDRRTVFFVASADPFGDNPSEECQVFSIDRTGANLRQLTRFRETNHSVHGCDFNIPVGSGCATTGSSSGSGFGQDTMTQAILFYSSCNPLGRNPQGGQIFAMRPDGLDLRQLTDTRGLVTEADGTVIGEFPGPFVLSSGPR